MSSTARHLPLASVEPEPERPRNRSECRDGERPCPWVSCRYHLAIEVDERSGRVTERPALHDPTAPSCAIDVADSGEQTLERIGELLGVTRERVRQIETSGMTRMQKRSADIAPEGTLTPHVARRPRPVARDGREGTCQNPACSKPFMHYASRGYMPALCPECRTPHKIERKRRRDRTRMRRRATMKKRRTDGIH